MADAPALSSDAIAQALDEPIGAPPLATVARGKRSASIAIDDRTRPLKTAVILRAVVDQLTRAGISNEHITVIVASGAHRPASDHDFEAKIGRDLLAQVRAVAHDPERNLVETGATLGGVPVRDQPRLRRRRLADRHRRGDAASFCGIQRRWENCAARAWPTSTCSRAHTNSR